ncbi:MAG: hypothetical protein HYS13_03415 [Planctomycetia bacterium]|nr:hypothetical protein [Planctomycetia bacterium]
MAVKNDAPRFPTSALAALGAVAMVVVAARGWADEKQEKANGPSFPREHVEFFETSVRPLLVANCHECHGRRKQEAKLRLDSCEAVLAGGETGPAVIPGDPKSSLLISAVQHAEGGPQMPPQGKVGCRENRGPHAVGEAQCSLVGRRGRAARVGGWTASSPLSRKARNRPPIRSTCASFCKPLTYSQNLLDRGAGYP